MDTKNITRVELDFYIVPLNQLLHYHPNQSKLYSYFCCLRYNNYSDGCLTLKKEATYKNNDNVTVWT